MRNLWLLWPRIAYRLYRSDERRREDFLGTFAPFHLILVLVVWVAMLILGWGLFFYGIRDQLRPHDLTFGACVYYAGASLLTIGYGDIVSVTGFARIMSLFAASSGLGVVAVVTSFLFAVFGAFQDRETFVVTIGARAGVPPSGVGLLAVHGYAAIREDLAQVFRDGQEWTARIMESHLAYPILMMFRSSHDYESWVGTVGTLLDAAALVMSTVDPQDMRNSQTAGQARIMYDIGRHLTGDFAGYFKFAQVGDGRPGIERHEFDQACDHLEKAGYRLRDREAAWAEFSRLRSSYSGNLNALARWLEIPPVHWVGDRSLIRRQKAHMA
ncbi:MAG TPA: potassium channel family protein [Candidatus Baltobacteraceae bacterium]|nr:potassium channel family protein [Candidatus Baltobacteraceae bacterium]